MSRNYISKNLTNEVVYNYPLFVTKSVSEQILWLQFLLNNWMVDWLNWNFQEMFVKLYSGAIVHLIKIFNLHGLYDALRHHR